MAKASSTSSEAESRRRSFSGWSDGRYVLHALKVAVGERITRISVETNWLNYGSASYVHKRFWS